jgi:hypothetical protein
MPKASSRPTAKNLSILDRCYDFLNIFAEKIGEKIGVFWHKTKLNYEKHLIIGF